MGLTKEQIKALVADKIEYGLMCMESEIPIHGNVMASGDDAADRKAEGRVRSAVARGNQWAWGDVRVSAELTGVNDIGYDYLGCCSYKSAADFIENSGYYEDMKNAALDELVGCIHNNLAAYRTLGLIA